MVFRRNAWKEVDEQIANRLLELDPCDEEYAAAVRSYKTLKEAKGERARAKIDPNVLINAGVIIGTCIMTIYGEDILHTVVYSKYWPKILLPKLT